MHHHHHSHQPSGSFIISLVPLEQNCPVISENKTVDGTFQFQVWGQNPGCPNEHQNGWRIYMFIPPINRFWSIPISGSKLGRILLTYNTYGLCQASARETQANALPFMWWAVSKNIENPGLDLQIPWFHPQDLGHEFVPKWAISQNLTILSEFPHFK